MPNSPLNLISRTFWSWRNPRRKRYQPQPGWGEKPWEARCGCVLGRELQPHVTSLPQFGDRFTVALHTGRAASRTTTHLSAINRPLECDVLGPNPWVMIIGGKCLWGNSYWALGVLERIYLLKISQQQFSLQLSSLSLYFWNIHETCSDFKLKISTRWVVPGILHLGWYLDLFPSFPCDSLKSLCKACIAFIYWKWTVLSRALRILKPHYSSLPETMDLVILQVKSLPCVYREV